MNQTLEKELRGEHDGAVSRWPTVQLRPLLKKAPRYGINAAAVQYRSSLPTYIRITDISDDGKFRANPRVSVDHPASAEYFLQRGDIVVARTGASVGKSYVYAPEDGPLVYAGFLICLTPDDKRLDPRYLGYCLQTKRYWDWVSRTSVRSGQPGINGVEYGTFTFDLPPKPEQTAIADALADVDKQVLLLEKLIEKKTSLKQGMMQELLGGKVRLPGFTAPWVTCPIADLADQYRGSISPKTQPTVVFQHFSLPAFDAGQTPAYDRGASIDSNKYRVPTGAVLVSKLNPRIPRVWAPNDILETAVCSTEFIVCLPKENTDRSFLKWLLKSESVTSRMSLLATGTTGSHQRMHPRQVAQLEVKVPLHVDEQVAIATMLDDADLSIATLRSELAKTLNIKQGMLQELLTGRTRLPSHGARV